MDHQTECLHKKQEVTFLKNKNLNETNIVRATCVDCKQDLGHHLAKQISLTKQAPQ